MTLEPHHFLHLKCDRLTSSSDEIAQLATDLWPPCPPPRFPTPERRETRTMPSKDGLRLNDMRRIEQARPEPGQPHHQGPVTAAQSKAGRRTPQGNAELMAKEQVLGFKSSRRLEEVDNEHCERMQDREHRPQSCDDSSRRCDSQAGWNFRKGQVNSCALLFVSEPPFEVESFDDCRRNGPLFIERLVEMDVVDSRPPRPGSLAASLIYFFV